ncbi:MAG: hypothetical protein E4G98_07140 [Promethearchaeota archaeon]|nr:MAG: hypothetical protein E4G98_07140 [Candidatus Lokiarchaeota archaeon]
MVGSNKTVKGRKTHSPGSTHWENLPRDNKGLWSKRRKKKNASTSHKNSFVPPSQSKTINHTIPSVASTQNSLCPRCGGDMRGHRIRCGPERLVSVKKCNICNYWIPLAEVQKPNPIEA